MFGNLGTAELLIIAVVILVFFGSKKLNELARGLGESTKEFKKVKQEYHKAMSNDYPESSEDDSEDEKPSEKKKNVKKKKSKIS